NLANLLLARATSRKKEFSVRAALGAGVWPIARTLICESLLLSILGGALGLLLATTTFQYLAHFAPGDLAGLKSLSVDLRVIGFTAALAIAVTVVFSLVPLLHLRRLDLNSSLKQNARALAGSDASRTRAWLVIAQVAIVFVLATSAALLMQTFARLRSVDPGFRTVNILTVGLPRYGEAPREPSANEIWQRELLGRVSSIPGVVSAGFTNHVPIAFKGDITQANAEGRDPRAGVQCRLRTAGPGFMATMGIPILQGRDIEETDHHGVPLVVLVNKTLARELWPQQDPIGRKLVLGSNAAPLVIGVVRDIRQEGLDSAPKPEFYLSSLQAPSRPGSLVIHTQVDPGSVAGAVRSAVWSLDPEQPVNDLFTMSQVLDKEVLQRRLQASLLGGFAGLAILLAAVGLYGVLSYALGRQIPEYAVRLALGSSPRMLLGRIVGQGITMTLLGLTVGLVAALALSRLLAAFLFGIEATDPATYALVASVLLLTSLLASYLPGRRAMRVDPATALRQSS
ncbi:MAG: FtsX-like permease family protein, partial [Bryobacterales bacterium]|nr:FtsX-like permease family protein [Bryobacterales bacterium]